MRSFAPLALVSVMTGCTLFPRENVLAVLGTISSRVTYTSCTSALYKEDGESQILKDPVAAQLYVAYTVAPVRRVYRLTLTCWSGDSEPVTYTHKFDAGHQPETVVDIGFVTLE